MSDKSIEELRREIQEVLGQLDEESLSFLKEQAAVLLYNMKVREKNAELAELREQQHMESDGEEIAISESSVYFEQLKNGKFFNLCIADEKIFMDYKEIIALVKIARAAESPGDGSLRLYNWFSRERKDVLVDGHIGSSGSPTLRLIYEELLEGFESG